jgi:hypothetical protein
MAVTEKRSPRGRGAPARLISKPLAPVDWSYPIGFERMERDFHELAGEAPPKRRRTRIVSYPTGHVPTSDLLDEIEARLGRRISAPTLTRLCKRGVIVPATLTAAPSRGGRPSKLWPLAPTLEAIAAEWEE